MKSHLGHKFNYQILSAIYYFLKGDFDEFSIEGTDFEDSLFYKNGKLKCISEAKCYESRGQWNFSMLISDRKPKGPLFQLLCREKSLEVESLIFFSNIPLSRKLMQNNAIRLKEEEIKKIEEIANKNSNVERFKHLNSFDVHSFIQKLEFHKLDLNSIEEVIVEVVKNKGITTSIERLRDFTGYINSALYSAGERISRVYLMQQLFEKKVSHYFREIWADSNKISHETLMDLRPYNPSYFTREEDFQSLNLVKKDKSILIIGKPLAGKTRMIYELVKRHDSQFSVLIPEYEEIPDFLIFPDIKTKKKKIILLDDIDIFANNHNFHRLLRKAKKEKIPIIASCKSGIVLKNLETSLKNKNIILSTLFDSIIELKNVSEQQAKKIAQANNKKWFEVEKEFNGTIGSIFLPLAVMKDRFRNATPEQKLILRTLTKLLECGIYMRKLEFPKNWVKQFAFHQGINQEKYLWDNWLDALVDLEFISLHSGNILIEETYLTSVVSFSEKIDLIELLDEALGIFIDDYLALFKLGNRCFRIGNYRKDLPEFLDLAERSLNRSKEICFVEKIFPLYGHILNNLGVTLSALAEISNLEENSSKSLQYLSESLDIFENIQSIEMVSMILGNMASTYLTLAQNSSNNRKRNVTDAISACEKALNMIQKKEDPLNFAFINNNLGNALRLKCKYFEEERSMYDCFQKCEDAYLVSLDVYKKDKFPIDYAEVKNNLANLYSLKLKQNFSEKLSRKAIRIFKEVLQIFKNLNLHLHYTMALVNLGNIYFFIVKEKKIRDESFEKALKLYNSARDKFRKLKKDNHAEIVEVLISNLYELLL